MNLRFFLMAGICSTTLSSCLMPLPIIGGGIAGGAMDSAWVRAGAKNYKRYVSPEAAVEKVPAIHKPSHATRDEELHDFPIHTLKSIGEEPTEFAGVTIRYKNHRITLSKGGRVLRKETLPSAYYYSGLQVASLTIQDRPCLLFLTYTRGSTGCEWMGLFRADGTPLFMESSDDVFALAPAPNGFLQFKVGDYPRNTAWRISFEKKFPDGTKSG